MDTQTQILKFEFTVEEANHILQGLNELPAKIANPLIKKIIDAANAQVAPPPEPETILP